MNDFIQRHRFEPKRRTLSVRDTAYLTPHMIRINFEGEDLADFDSPGADDHVKLVLPAEGEKPEMREYTPRRFDASARILTLDFAIHDAGPATAWAVSAKPGDKLVVAGPRGSQVIAPVFDWWLLIGDETALPAIGRRAEELPYDTRIVTLAAVPGPEDEQVFQATAPTESHWVHRRVEATAEIEPLLSATRSLTLPEGTGFIWIAAEAQVARALRDHCERERGHPRTRIKAAGYWIKGEAAASDKSLD